MLLLFQVFGVDQQQHDAILKDTQPAMVRNSQRRNRFSGLLFVQIKNKWPFVPSSGETSNFCFLLMQSETAATCFLVEVRCLFWACFYF